MPTSAPLDLLPREQLSQLQFGCVHHLTGCRRTRRACREHLPHKEIGLGTKRQDNLPSRACSASTRISAKRPVACKALNALPDVLPLKGRMRFLGNQFEQARKVFGAYVGEVDGFHGEAFVGIHSRLGRCGNRRLRILFRRRSRRSRGVLCRTRFRCRAWPQNTRQSRYDRGFSETPPLDANRLLASASHGGPRESYKAMSHWFEKPGGTYNNGLDARNW